MSEIEEEFRMTKEEFRQALSKVVKRGLDAVCMGGLPEADFVEIMKRFGTVAEELSDGINK